MLSAPKEPVPKCPPDCTCSVCRDVHVRWASRLNTETVSARDWWTTLNQQPTEPATDTDLIGAFDADMAALHTRLATSSPTSQENPA